MNSVRGTAGTFTRGSGDVPSDRRTPVERAREEEIEEEEQHDSVARRRCCIAADDGTGGMASSGRWTTPTKIFSTRN